MPWLINAAQFDKFRKSQKNVIILDASLHLDGRDGKQEFLERHIVDAQFFDITAFNDKRPDAPHSNMVITDEALIGEKLGQMGIRNDCKIFIYDNSNLHTACRAVWMLKLFGHNPQQLYILDGGLHAWLAYGGRTETGETTVAPKQYTASFQSRYLCTLDQMKANAKNPKAQVLDARHAVRYAGGPEQRPNLRTGHIPGSFCFPFTTIYNSNGYLRNLDRIRNQLSGIGIELNTPFITTCGSGTTAPILNFMLDLLGQENNAVYNGSWTEWGSEKLLAGETDLSERPVETCTDD